MKFLLRLVLLVVSMLTTQLWAYPPTLKMPVMANESMRCDQGYDECDPTHCSQYTYGKAWDLNLSGTTGDDDLGFPVVACASGHVDFAQNYIPGQADEWGNCVVIKYDNDAADHSGLYAHLQQIFVKKKEYVLQGQVIGTIGKGDGGYYAHLHYQVQSGDNPDAQSVAAQFSDVGLPTSPNNYTSQNSNIIDVEYAANGQSSSFGAVYHDTRWYNDDYDTYAPNNLYSGYNTSNTCYIKEFNGGTFSHSGIVYDALAGARRSFTIRTGFWDDGHDHGWSELGGPTGSLGMPLTEEYSMGTGHSRQDFQLGYLEYIDGRTPYEVTVESYGVVSGFSTYAPGWTYDDWNRQYSYIFTDCYARNGARVTVGCALQKVIQNWQNTAYHTQRYDFGSNDQGIIVYDPESWVDDAGGANKAYYVYGGFYNAFSFGQVQQGGGYVSMPWAIGAPVNDRSGDMQHFKYGYMVDDDGVTVVYNSADEQIWTSEYGMGGGFASDANCDLVALYAYGSSALRAHTFISSGSDFDFQGDYGWWNSTEYPRANVKKSASGDFNGDGVTDYANLYYYGPTSSTIHVFLGSGSDFTYQGDDGWWESDDYASGSVIDMVSGDFDEDGYDDLANVYSYGGTTTAIHIFLSTGTSFTYEGDNGWFRDTDYAASCVKQVVAKDFDSDGDADIACMYRYGPVTTAWHLFRSSGSSLSLETWWYDTDYASTSVVEAMGGLFTADGYPDIACIYSYGGYTTATHVFYSNGSSFTLVTFWSSTDYSSAAVVKATSGDFNGDGLSDVAAMYSYGPVTTRIHIFLSWGSGFTFAGDYGWFASTDYAGSSVVALLPGHFNGYSAAKIAVQPDEDVLALPSAFRLSQNYPNPFNPATTISYSLPAASHVSLEVFNVTGQKVATLVDEYLALGEHSTRWDCSKCASGVYFYRLRVGEAVETRKMVLLK